MIVSGTTVPDAMFIFIPPSYLAAPSTSSPPSTYTSSPSKVFDGVPFPTLRFPVDISNEPVEASVARMVPSVAFESDSEFPKVILLPMSSKLFES